MAKPPQLNIDHYGVRGTLRRIVEAFELANGKNEAKYYFADETEASNYQIPHDKYHQHKIVELVAAAGFIKLKEPNYDVSVAPHPTNKRLGVFAGIKGILSVDISNPQLSHINQLIDNAYSDEKLAVRIILDGCDVKLVASDERQVLVKPALRYQLAPHIFINHILNSTLSKEVRLDEVQEVEGLKDVDSLQEMMRRCGFNKHLKQVFTEVCTKKRLEIRNPAFLTPQQIVKLFSGLERNTT